MQCNVRNLIKKERSKSNSMMNISISKYLIGSGVIRARRGRGKGVASIANVALTGCDCHNS